MEKTRKSLAVGGAGRELAGSGARPAHGCTDREGRAHGGGVVPLTDAEEDPVGP